MIRPSALRPTLCSVLRPAVAEPIALQDIIKAVQKRKGLLHGKLESGQKRCAIGFYFTDHSTTGLSVTLIDEVATVNDSVPHLTPAERKSFVLLWLQNRVKQIA